MLFCHPSISSLSTVCYHLRFHFEIKFQQFRMEKMRRFVSKFGQKCFPEIKRWIKIWRRQSFVSLKKSIAQTETKLKLYFQYSSEKINTIEQFCASKRHFSVTYDHRTNISNSINRLHEAFNEIEILATIVNSQQQNVSFFQMIHIENILNKIFINYIGKIIAKSKLLQKIVSKSF